MARGIDHRVVRACLVHPCPLSAGFLAPLSRKRGTRYALIACEKISETLGRLC